MSEQQLQRAMPAKRFEYVDVTFGAADTDQVIRHTLRPTDKDAVRWQDVTPNAASSTVARVYRSTAPTRMAWGDDYIVLRSTVASYATRLLLFLERD